METWYCRCGEIRLQPERPPCLRCGESMLSSQELEEMPGNQWEAMRRNIRARRAGLDSPNGAFAYDRDGENMRRIRELVGAPQRANERGDRLHSEDILAIAERIDELRRDPLAALESRIATASLAELDAWGQRLESIGTALVEQAAKIRRKLAG